MRQNTPWAPPPALPTPYALINHDRLRRNLDGMQSMANRVGVRLRPHIKTHKSPALAALQIENGAIGVTASKPSEALPFLAAGVPSLLLAFPIVDEARASRIVLDTQRAGAELAFIVDSHVGRQSLDAAGRLARQPLRVQIKIDVGLGRCGVKPNSKELTELGRSIAESPHLCLTGLLSHAGHAYGAQDLDQLLEIAEDERRSMIAARDRLDFLQHPLALSVGSTPTVLAAHDFSQIDEIRPGNYALLDLTAVRLGVAREDDIAFGIVTTIVSSNERFYITDAGSKTLSSDMGPHGSTGLTGYGKAFAIDRDGFHTHLGVAKLSEEHGFVPRNGTDLRIGERLLVLPNHSCATVNLHDRLVVQKQDDFECWDVTARGALT